MTLWVVLGVMAYLLLVAALLVFLKGAAIARGDPE
jgi:hypothetical protein